MLDEYGEGTFAEACRVAAQSRWALSCPLLERTHPLGAFNQTGDVTHVTVSTAGRIRQIGPSAGLRLVAVFNSARPIATTARKLLAQRGRYLVRGLLETFVGKHHLGSVVPLEPNITVVLGKAQGTPQAV
jgi:hypothetical protein